MVKKCVHGRTNYGFYCKQCKIEGIGGNGICKHLREKRRCKNCGGNGICKHNKHRIICKQCKAEGMGGGSLCFHQRYKSRCKQCNGGSICEHQKVRNVCKYCRGGGICKHQRERTTCKDCGGSSICKHRRRRSHCKDCGGSSICEHQRERNSCSKCREALPIGECLTRYKHACVICGKRLQTLKRQLEKTCYAHSQEYKKRPEHYWQEHVMKQIQFKPSYIDQPLKSCDKLDVFRPDLCYLTKDIAFALEFDEESHSAYEVSCELKKTNNMKDLFPNRKLVLIRMNPHPNKDVPKEYKDMAQRTDFMLDLFQSVLENPSQYDLSDKATNVFYLFYGKNGLKHIQVAEKCEGVIILDKFFCSK